ncbi:MAG: LysR family transcriptional regulator [Cellvibrionaceae bacterium]
MQTNLPNIRHLRVVQQVAFHNSISKASANIFLSQPAITQAISKLEQQLEHSLFDRRSSGMYLTTAGEVFHGRIERAMSILLEGVKEAGRVSSSPEVPNAAHIVQLLTTTQLRALIAVYEAQNFSLAGRNLGISQSSVHRAARELEDIMQITLFEKSNVGIIPTKAADALTKAAKLAFSEIRQGFDELSSLHSRDVGRIIIGSMPLARTSILPAAINQFEKQYPDIMLSVVDGPYSDLLYHLRHGDIDMLIGALRFPAPSDNIIQRELFNPHLAIFARTNHPLQQIETPQLTDLNQYSWVVPRKGTPARKVFEQLFEEADLPIPTRLVETSSQLLVRELLLGSDRIALTSAEQFRREEGLDLLKPIDINLQHTKRPVGLTLRSNWQPTRSQQAFIEALEGNAKDF